MLNIRVILLLCVSCLSCMTAALTIGDIPECATNCVLRALSHTGDAQRNVKHLCNDRDFNQEIIECASAACSMKDSLKFMSLYKTICAVPETDDRKEFQIILIVFAVIAMIFALTRLISHWLVKTSWGTDDSLLVLCFVILIPFTVITQIMIGQGIGIAAASLSNQQITRLLKYTFIWHAIYVADLAVAKASILFFFLRIFPDNKFRIVTWVTIAFTAIAGVAFFVFNFLQVHPLSLVWTGWRDMEANGLLFVHLIKFGFAHSVVNCVLDVWMLILPMTQLFKIGLRLRKKIGVMAMFGLGLFLTVVSVIRTVVIAKLLLSPTTAETGSQTSVLWSCIELDVGVVVACIPQTRQLIQTLMTKMNIRKQGSVSSGSKPIFVDRSLARIAEEEDIPTLRDEGGLTTGTTASSAPPARGDKNELDIVSDSEVR